MLVCLVDCTVSRIILIQIYEEISLNEYLIIKTIYIVICVMVTYEKSNSFNYVILKAKL